MNFNTGGPSNYYNFDNNELQEQLANELEAIEARQDAAIRMYHNNDLLLMHLLEQQQVPRAPEGSHPGREVVYRDREGANLQLWNDYFCENPRYDDAMFHRRFRMSRPLFLRIVEAVTTHDAYFRQKRDGLGRLGLSSIQKVTAAFRMLAYGVPADATDEYIKIGESTAVESLKKFCRAVVEVFGSRYLRSPNADDVARLLHIGEQRGFPGMLGSLDCMHWRWKNCPTAWAGQYSGRSGAPTIILEIVADYDLWIWHANFGMPGSNNDINVLDRSNLFRNLTRGIAPPANYTIQGLEYDMEYYLADGIYPKWATLVQTIQKPRRKKEQYFATKQESCRKDVERAFGVLQSRFSIIAGPVRFWKKKVLRDIMTACIIMHNMIIEDECDVDAPIREWVEVPTPQVEIATDETRFNEFIGRYQKIKDEEAHYALRNALIEHLWEEYSNSNN